METLNHPQQNTLIETLFQHLPQLIFWKDIHSVYLGCNDKYAQLLGLNGPQEIIGKTDYTIGWLPDGDKPNRILVSNKGLERLIGN